MYISIYITFLNFVILRCKFHISVLIKTFLDNLLANSETTIHSNKAFFYAT